MQKSRYLLFAAAALLFTAVQAAQAQKIPSPELVGQLTKQLKITPQQAAGGAGAIFGAAKSQLSPADFGKIAGAVPGMDGLLRSAPKTKGNMATDMLGQVGGMLPGKAGGIAQTAGAFKALGLKPEMAMQFLPILTQFVNVKGGAEVANILGGVFGGQ